MTFDITFDYTFQGVMIHQNPSELPPCGSRRRGAYLTWFTAHGWAYWLFVGYGTQGAETTSPGSYEDINGVTVYSEKKTKDVHILRTDGLTHLEAKLVAGVVKSSKVYVLAPDEQNQFHAVPVSVDPGSLTEWEDASSRSYIAVQVKFGTVYSPRA